MKKKLFFVGILAMLLVFGMIIVGCDNGNGNSNGNGNGNGGGGSTDSVLNGTWVQTSYSVNGVEFSFPPNETMFNNGNYETTVDGVPMAKGTYTTSMGQYTCLITHRYGGYAGMPSMGFSSRWYTKDEVKTIMETYYREMGLTEELISTQVSNMVDSAFFSGWIWDYTVSGNTLITTHGGVKTTSTKKK
jgi:hypothetical protein